MAGAEKHMSDIDSLQWWVNWINYGVIGALALSFIFGGLSIFFSKSLGEMKDAKSAQDQQESNETIAEINLKLTKAETERAQAQKDLLELQNRLASRVLTSEQSTNLLKILKVHPVGHVDVQYVSANAESEGFAKQIYSVLRQAGWTGDLISTIDSYGVSRGLSVIVQDANTPEAVTLQNGLKSIGLEVGGKVHPKLPNNSILLIVGVKP
jgi:hypothetical protein